MRARAILLVAAAVVLLGGACGDEDGDSVASGDLPVLPIGTGGGSAAGSASALRATAEDADIAPGEPMPPAEQITYRLADDVTGLGGEAAAYKVPSEVDKGEVKELAKRLGVDEDEIEVYEDAGVPWTYGGDMAVSSSSVAVDSCERPPECSEADACTAVCTSPEPTTPPAPPPDLPGRDEAERIASRVLGDGYTVEAEEEPTPEGWGVYGTLRLDGVEVRGLEATVAIGSKGKVLYASGYLARPERLGSYPLVDRDEAQERFDEFGGGGGIAIAEPAMAPDPGVDPAQPAPSVVEREVLLTSVTVVLEFVPGFCSGDPGYLVPAYETAPEQFVIPAVDDSALGEGPASEPSDPCPGDEPGQTEPGVIEPDPGPGPEPGATATVQPLPPDEESMRETLEERRAADSGEAEPGR